MQNIITEELYNVALSKVEELLHQVNESTPDNDPKMVELCHFSDIVEQYENEKYPIHMPTFVQVIEERLAKEKMQKKTLAQKIGVSASRISDFLSEKAEPSISQARSICQVLHIDASIALQL